MSDTQSYPYETRLNLYYSPLEIVEEKKLADECQFQWYNQTLCQVNGSVVRLGVFQGEYHWHKHDDDDEFFYVLEGQLLIDLEGRMRHRLHQIGIRCILPITLPLDAERIVLMIADRDLQVRQVDLASEPSRGRNADMVEPRSLHRVHNAIAENRSSTRTRSVG